MTSSPRPAAWKLLLAFAIIYFVWGSTYLAVRIGVREVPPFLLAGVRFVIAGIVLYAWTRVHGTPSPTMREWSGVLFMSTLIFVFDYGLLFWAETRVPSGVAAVVMAIIPGFMALLEIMLLRTQRLTARLAIALLLGVAGVAVLVARSPNLGGAPVDALGAAALVFASINWSIASVLSRKLPLPSAKVMSSGAQMLAGGVMLTIVSALLGEMHGFRVQAVSREAWFALVYLIVAGSIIGFTAYIWLLHHESPTKVGTYAYVNPVVAVVIGYFWGGEVLGARTVVGTLLVLVSVVVITTMPKRVQSDVLTEAAQLSLDAE